jgi:hypothetical protein
MMAIHRHRTVARHFMANKTRLRCQRPNPSLIYSLSSLSASRRSKNELNTRHRVKTRRPTGATACPLADVWAHRWVDAPLSEWLHGGALTGCSFEEQRPRWAWAQWQWLSSFLLDGSRHWACFPRAKKIDGQQRHTEVLGFERLTVMAPSRTV